MITFFFKPKKIIVDAFIGEKYITAYETVPVDYSHKFYPQWWKNLEKAEFDFDLRLAKSNSKSCAAIIDFYQKGIILPLWSDFALNVKTGEWDFSDKMSTADYHGYFQREGFKEDYQHFKLTSPWLFRSEKNVSFAYVPDFYNQNTPFFEAPPGIVNYHDMYVTSFNFFVPKYVDNFVMPVGTPLANIIPLSERPIELRRHLISEPEFHILNLKKHTRISFARKHMTIKRLVKEQELKNAKKCPFGFGRKE